MIVIDEPAKGSRPSYLRWPYDLVNEAKLCVDTE